MTASTWSLYVARIIGADNQGQAEERTGINQATISRWLRGEKIPTEAAQAAKFAQGYGRSVLEAFVAAGMLPLDDARKGLSAQSLALLDDLRRTGSDVDNLTAVLRTAKASRKKPTPPTGERGRTDSA